MLIFLKKHVWILVLIASIVMIPYALNTQTELNIRALITAVGIDRSEQGYRLTAQVVLPGDSGEQGSERIEFVSVDAQTMAEGVKRMSIKFGKAVGLSQVDYLIVGESMLDSKDMSAELDYFIRYEKIPNSIPFFCCDGSAEEMLQKTKNMDRETSIVMQKLFLFKEKSSTGVHTPIFNFLNEGFSKSKTSLISGVEIESSSSDGGSGGQSSGGGGSTESEVGGGSTDDSINKLRDDNDIYIFKENQFVGRITEYDQKIGVYLVNKPSRELTLSITDINGDIYKNASVSVELRNKRLKFKPSFENGKPIMTLKLSFNNNNVNELITEDKTLEHHDTKRIFLNEFMKEQISNKIKVCISSVFENTKDIADVFKLENEFYKYKTRDYKFYKNIYGDDFVENIELRFDINVKGRM